MAIVPADKAVIGLDYCEVTRGDYSGGEWNERTDRLCTIIDDPSAIEGSAFRLALDGESDALTWRFANLAVDADARYRVRVHLRVDRSEGADGEVARAFLGANGEELHYDPRTNEVGTGWNWIDVGTLKLSPDHKLTLRPPRREQDSPLHAVYVDAVEIAKESR